MKLQKRKQKINIYKTIASSFLNIQNSNQQLKQFSFQSVRNISQIQPLSKNNKNNSSFSQLNLFTTKKSTQFQKQKNTPITNQSNLIRLRANTPFQVIDQIGETNWKLNNKISKITQIIQTQQANQLISINQKGLFLGDCNFKLQKNMMLQVFQSKRTENELQIISAIKKQNQSNMPLISYELSPYSDLISFLPLLSDFNNKNQSQVSHTKNMQRQINYQEITSSPKEVILMLWQLDKEKQTLKDRLSKVKGSMKNQINIQFLNVKQNMLNSLIKYYNLLMQSQDNLELYVQVSQPFIKKQEQLFFKLKSIFIICKYIQNFVSLVNQNSSQNQQILTFIKKQTQRNSQFCQPKIIQAVVSRYNKKIKQISWLSLIRILLQFFNQYKCLSCT